jgi:hypothetical protein
MYAVLVFLGEASGMSLSYAIRWSRISFDLSLYSTEGCLIRIPMSIIMKKLLGCLEIYQSDTVFYCSSAQENSEIITGKPFLYPSEQHHPILY